MSDWSIDDRLWRLPKSWCWVPLEDIARTSSGGTPSRTKPVFYGGTIPWVKSGELRDGMIFEAEEQITEAGLASSSAKIFPRGTLCIALYGATVGRLGILGIDAATNQAVCGIFLHHNVNPRFIFRFLESQRAQLIKQSVGGAQPNISQALVRQIPVPLAPSAEQNRILEELEKQFTRLEAGVGALKRVQANLKCYRAAVLKAAVEGRLVPTEAELARREGRSYEPASELLARMVTQPLLAVSKKAQAGVPVPPKPKSNEPVAPDTTDLPKLPEGWAWAQLSQLLTYIRNGISRKPDSEDGIPILRINAVRPRRVDMNEVRYLDGALQLYADYILQEGDLLFTRYNGNPALTGVCGVVRTVTRPTVHPDKLIRVKIAQGICLPAFIEVVLNVGASRDFIAGKVRTTAGQAGISGQDIRGTPVPLAPLKEQSRIVAEVERRLSVIDELEIQVEANLKRAERLRQAILKRAFEGKLVPQDPDDEPASMLLERIRNAKPTGKSACATGDTATLGCARKHSKSKKGQAGVPEPQK